MKALIFAAIATSLLMTACTNDQPIPPYQSGDGGRGLNPGARAQASTGAGVDRTQ